MNTINLSPQVALRLTAEMMRRGGLNQWTSGACARSNNGEPIAAESENAVRWCALGWMIRTVGKPDAVRAMNWFNTRSRVGALHQINDTLGFYHVVQHMELAAA